MYNISNLLGSLMNKYDDLKNETYLYLLSNNNDIKRLILAILVISLCHDRCINKNELFVSKYFIQKCSNLIIFKDNYDKMCKLTDEKKVFIN